MANKKRTVVVDEGTSRNAGLTGKRFTLVEPPRNGEEPCPGDAHTNAFIDNCMVCLPYRWGVVPSYESVDVLKACSAGLAVPMRLVPRDARGAVEKAEREGKIRMVGVTEKRKGSTSSYMVYVGRVAL